MKIELHRHIGGSIRPNTVYEILKKQGRGSYFTVEEVAREMQIQPTEKLTFQNFLSKFQILETIKWDEWAITHSLKQVVYDLVREGIEYSELKFSIDKYAQRTSWPDLQIIEFIYKVVQDEASKWGIIVELVLSLKYESDRKRQREIADLITNEEVAKRVVGIDLVGDEQFFDADFYAPIFETWRKAGKGLEAHAGESATAENVRLAIEKLGVQRIAHGIKAADSPDILALAKERGVCFDVAMTSNILTGQVSSYQEHPVGKMIKAGCAITIGTDDPAILDVDLNHEYIMLQKHFNLSDEQIMDIMENSYKHAFVDWSKVR